jgi:hypothetical protein
MFVNMAVTNEYFHDVTKQAHFSIPYQPLKSLTDYGTEMHSD